VAEAGELKIRRREVLFVWLTLALGLGRPAAAQGAFADVPPGHCASDAMEQLAAQGLIIGYPDGTFGGRQAMTRDELAVLYWRTMYRNKGLPLLIELTRRVWDGPAPLQDFALFCALARLVPRTGRDLGW
jgi:S-layer homology domain